MKDYYKDRVKKKRGIKEKDLIQLVSLVDLRSKANRREVKKILKRCKCHYQIYV